MKSCAVLVVGAGPAGATAATLLARAGGHVILLDRAQFPRDKVCGDCVNPSAWRILERLGVESAIREAKPVKVNRVDFHGAHGERVGVDVPDSERAEFVMRRRDFDSILVRAAVTAGAELVEGATVQSLESGWRVTTNAGIFEAPVVLAADGRNSTVARLLGRLPGATRERVAIQTHALSQSLHPGRAVRMFFHRFGYGGIAAVSSTESNLCLVARAQDIDALRAYAESEFALPPQTRWASITPLQRDDARPVAGDCVFLLGDAARVVEPFTGEGIYYAMRSGELAADSLVAAASCADAERRYQSEHAQIYAGRLWVNRLARAAALRPLVTSRALGIARWWPGALGLLTRKVVAGAGK